MEQVYARVISESRNSAQDNICDNSNSLETLTMQFEQSNHGDDTSDRCLTQMPSNDGKIEETISERSVHLRRSLITATTSAQKCIQAKTVSGMNLNSNSGTDGNVVISQCVRKEAEYISSDDTDSDVEILDWNPGTDVKPVIKCEINNMDWK